MDRYFDFLQDHKRLILAVWLLAILIAASGLPNLKISADNRVFYSATNEEFNQLLEFEQKYLPNNNILFLVSRSKTGSLAEIETAISWVSEQAWAIENVIRVDSLSNYQILRTTGPDQLDLNSALDEQCLAEKKCSISDLAVSNKGSILGRLVGKDRESFAVVLTLSLDVNNTSEIADVMSAVQYLRSEFASRHANFDLFFTGGIPMMAAFKQAAEQDSATLIPATLLIMFATAWWALRNVKVAMVLLGLGSTSAIFALGVSGYFGVVLNTATAISSIVIITLVVATSMHYASSYLNDLALYPKEVAAQYAMDVNFKPIVLTATTSALSFLSMTFADAPPIGELGVISAAGLMFGAIQTVVVGPLILTSLRLDSKQGPAQNYATFIARTEMHKKYWLPTTLVIAVCIAGLGRISINDDFVSYFGESFEFRKQTDIVTKKLASPNHIEIDVIADVPEGIFEPQYVAIVAEITSWLREQKLVSNVYSLADIFDELQPLFEHPISQSSVDEIAQYYLAYELSIPYGQSGGDFTDESNSSSRISILLETSTSQQISTLIQDIESHLDSTTPYQTIVTGENVPVANLTKANFSQMVGGILLSLFTASLLVAVTLKSAKLALVCFTCTILPVLAGFGIWGWLYGEIGLAAVVVLAITIGIVVDDAIHLVSRFDHYSRGSSDNSILVTQKTIRLASGAIIATTIAMVFGFAVLTFSSFGINQALGLCTLFVLLTALATVLFLLPKLLQQL